MTEVGSNTTFSGTQKGLQYIDKFAYAASGSVANASTGGADTTLLDFTTGNFTWVGTLDFTNTMVASNNVYLNIFMNGALISESIERTSSSLTKPIHFNFIIPAYTEFIVKWGNNHSTLNGSVFMSGRMYK